MTSGVYKIVNKINNKIYIGSSTRSIKRRFWEHLVKLKNNKHVNKHLQHAFNLYGEENFAFEVIKYCAAEQCLIEEQYYKDFYKSYNEDFGYDICKIAGNTLGVTWGEDRRKKLEVYLSNKPESHRKAQSNSLKNNTKFINIISERCKVMSENNKRGVIVTDLENNILYEFNSIKECSLELNVSLGKIKPRLEQRVKSNYENKWIFKYKQ